mgnify:CR=1 FL=1
MTRQAWVNGVYVAAEEARISPFDRGFLFGDSIYEARLYVAGNVESLGSVSHCISGAGMVEWDADIGRLLVSRRCVHRRQRTERAST